MNIKKLLAALVAVTALAMGVLATSASAWNCPPGTHDTGHSCAPNTPPPPPPKPPPVKPPPVKPPPVQPPVVVPPPPVVPPTITPPVTHQPAGRWGYCDANNQFVNLEKDQPINSPGTIPPQYKPPFRDADVDKIVEGTQVNARCDVKPQAVVPPAATPTPVAAVTPPAAPTVKKPVVKKPVVKKAKPKPPKKRHEVPPPTTP